MAITVMRCKMVPVQFKLRLSPFSLKLQTQEHIWENILHCHTLAVAAGVSTTEKESALTFFSAVIKAKVQLRPDDADLLI